MIDDYLEWSDYGAEENLGGRYDDTLWNSYHLFEGNSTRWLVLSIEFGPRDSVLEWADQVLAAHPEPNVIIVTHAYLYDDNTRYDYLTYGTSQAYRPDFYALAPPADVPEEARSVNDGEQIWQKLASRHANVKFVLCGHVHGDGNGRLDSIGESGNTVVQLLSNFQREVFYQGQSLDRSGFLRLMRFDERAGRVEVSTYSPWLDRVLTDEGNRFSVAL
jgi:hypothetical protein